MMRPFRQMILSGKNVSQKMQRKHNKVPCQKKRQNLRDVMLTFVLTFLRSRQSKTVHPFILYIPSIHQTLNSNMWTLKTKGSQACRIFANLYCGSYWEQLKKGRYMNVCWPAHLTKYSARFLNTVTLLGNS
jgi:hypothetical protein